MNFHLRTTISPANPRDRADPQTLNPATLRRYLLVIFAVTVAARLLNLGQLPLTGLEAITLRVAEMDWASLFRNRIAATHSPFYFALVKLGYFGDLFSARLPSAIFDGGTAVILAMIGNRIGHRQGAVLASGIFIFFPILWDTGQTARPYAALNFGTALLLLSAVAFCSRDGSADDTSKGARPFLLKVGLPISLAHIAGSVVAVFASSIGVFSWAAIDAAVLFTCCVERRWVAARTWIALRAVSVVIWLPLAVQLYKPTSSRAADYWVAGGLDRFWAMLKDVWLMGYPLVSGRVVSVWTQPTLLVLLPLLFLVGAVSLWRRQRGVATVLLGITLLPILAIAIISLHTPLAVPRYCQMAALGVCVVAAAGLDLLWRSRHPWAEVACTLAAAAIVINAWDFITRERRHDYRSASTTIVEADASNPLFLVSRSYVPSDATAYLAKREREYFRLGEMQKALARSSSVWLIDMRKGKDLRQALERIDAASVSITSSPQTRFTLHHIVRNDEASLGSPLTAD